MWMVVLGGRVRVVGAEVAILQLDGLAVEIESTFYTELGALAACCASAAFSRERMTR